MMNGAATVALGAYFLAVAYNRNEMKLVAALREETGFFKWIVAFLILYGLAQNDTTAPWAKGLTVAAFIGLGINVMKDQALSAGIQAIIDFFATNNLPPRGVTKP